MNSIKAPCIAIVLFLAAFTCAAQATGDIDPIDKAYKECLAKDTSAANIRDCAYGTYSRWDREQSKYYNRLLKVIKKDKDKAALIQSEKAWTAWRDAEFHSYDNMLNKPGNKFVEARADNRIAVVRERVRQLKAYYDVVTSKH